MDTLRVGLRFPDLQARALEGTTLRLPEELLDTIPVPMKAGPTSSQQGSYSTRTAGSRMPCIRAVRSGGLPPAMR